MEKQAASIDECVALLEHDVLDLLSLRGVITKLSTNWRQLKLSLREKGLLRGNQSVIDLQGSTPPSQAASIDTLSVDNLQGATPPALCTENAPQVVVDLQGLTPPVVSTEAEIQSGDDFQGSTPLTNVAKSTEAVPTKEGFIGPVQPTDTTRRDETVESNTEPYAKSLFIGPMIPGDAVKSTDSDVELISVEPGPAAVGFIGPVIPSGASKSVTPNQTAVYVEDEGTESVVKQNGNGNTETSESATVQSSGLQMS